MLLTLLSFYHAADQFSDQYKFSTWLFTIAKNTTLDHIKKKKELTYGLDKEGNQHRLLDMGPISGTPFVIFHPQVFPSFSNDNYSELDERSLRLIWPLRNGMLGPVDEVLTFDEHLERSRHGVELV